MPLDFQGDLNLQQLRAVEECKGPCLVLAGAGSGKTRVITYKLAYLITKRGIAPSHIMAVTFTNKAAGEMRSRVDALIGADLSRKGLWIGTFHSLCGRILREQIEKLELGYTNRFVIIDEDDRTRLVRQVLKELNMDPKTYEPQKIVYRISDAKSNLVGPEELSDYGYSYIEKAAATVYKLYQKRLQQGNLLDFDDLIALVIRLFDKCPEVEEYYSSKFEHVLVDEYQDVNKMQYELVKRLSKVHGNVTVVGDDDQSIYAFRGANSKLILGFEKDYPGAMVIKLEQNYRSTQSILDAANSLVARNRTRFVKKLWTDNGAGTPVRLFEALTPEEEASFVASSIDALIRGGADPRDMAVIYRMNSQSRVIEEALLASSIPYQIVGGLKFYERQEVKDVLAYLRLGFNPSDNLAFERAVSRPSRGFGDKSLSELKQLAVDHGTLWFTALPEWVGQAKAGKTKDKLEAFVDLIVHIGAAGESAISAANLVFASSGLLEQYSDEGEEGDFERQSRRENLGEFMRTVDEFDRMSEDCSLGAYLSQVALIQDQDSMKPGTGKGVLLITAHSAKGLEFSEVFVVGAEEGVFPHRRALDSSADIEEERRLFYVACTRARKELVITYCTQRTSYYGSGFQEPSRFIKEMELTREKVAGVSSHERPELIEGDTVMHNIFGTGKVLEVFYDGNDQFTVIDFKKVGIKKLAAQYAQLKKV
ncbi:MAG TPA: UvrD-helicase domain-containing protein [Candidatus Deferrimicrobium sp.]|nr:UvrD-helicase domain-containing protein [Candidatus Deferrimicrobium sp.]